MEKKDVISLFKNPFFLTLLVSLITYQLNHLIGYIADTPYICYQYKVVKTVNSGDDVIHDMEIQIENLSRKKHFSNLVFEIKYRSALPEPREVYNPKVVSIAPAMIMPDSAKTDSLVNRYCLLRLQPGGKYLLTLTVLHHKKIREFPKIYLDCHESVFLTENNIQTLLIRNQFTINLFLLLFCIPVLAYCFYLISKKK